MLGSKIKVTLPAKRLAGPLSPTSSLLVGNPSIPDPFSPSGEKGRKKFVFHCDVSRNVRVLLGETFPKAPQTEGQLDENGVVSDSRAMTAEERLAALGFSVVPVRLSNSSSRARYG